MHYDRIVKIAFKFVAESEHVMTKDQRKQVTAKQKKAIIDNSLYLSLFAQHEESKRNMSMLRDAYAMNDMFDLHIEAIKEDNVYENRKRFTNKEKNAEKRARNLQVRLSTFCKSQKVSSQAFRIDEALKDFHTMRELQTILSDCRVERIKSHISFLKSLFADVCYYEEKFEDKKLYFRFVLKKDLLLEDYSK